MAHPSCGLKLDDEAVRVAVGLRLGLDLSAFHMNAIVAHQWTLMGFTALSAEMHPAAAAGRLGTMLSMTWPLQVLPQLELP